MTLHSVTIGDCDLWCGDCADVLDSLPVCDLLLTDPPYGVKRSGQRETKCRLKKHNRKKHEDYAWDSSPPEKIVFDKIREKTKHQIIWGGQYFTNKGLYPNGEWLFWDKGQRRLSMGDGELAWTNLDGAVRAITMNRSVLRKEGARHPTQKPVPVMEWCIEQAEKKKRKIETVLDPFMGSGSTGVACVRAGKRFAGIEREPEYFKIACERIAAEYLKLELDL